MGESDKNMESAGMNGNGIGVIVVCFADFTGLVHVVPNAHAAVQAACGNERFSDTNVHSSDGARVKARGDEGEVVLILLENVDAGQRERGHLIRAQETTQLLFRRRHGKTQDIVTLTAAECFRLSVHFSFVRFLSHIKFFKER